MRPAADADYWVAYRLDYLSNGRLTIDSSGLGGDPVAWSDIDAQRFDRLRG